MTHATDSASADANAAEDNAPWELVEVLREALPDLGADELQSLGRTVYSELELRVGRCLSDGLSDAELDEFSELMNAADEAASSAWLAEHRPDYRDVVAAERDAIVAETVAALGGEPAAPPEAAPGRPDAIVEASLAVAVQLLRGMHANVIRVDGPRAWVAQQCPDGQKHTVVVRVSDKGLMCLHSDGVASYSQARKAQLVSFAQNWNHERYWPKAYVIDSSDGDTCRVVAEIAYPLAPGIHRRLLGHLLGTALAYIRRMFDELVKAIDDVDPDAQPELF
ncbi:DUF5663 domain-containing protein [Mycolicibacterium hippocampi]|uniref:YbjN domain-containing protein n=1 Tax=Mycolicibacterium hippocampi TaxID=659824 RepID=A0A850PGD5_9MYCO|nr:DUF5663 domain-containing protein [Mycolicibacterium hippocampi]NVN49162.1 hypothetical protein [Mycolicibacterium hippocampi]